MAPAIVQQPGAQLPCDDVTAIEFMQHFVPSDERQRARQHDHIKDERVNGVSMSGSSTEDSLLKRTSLARPAGISLFV
jgi:hypothetical protein